MFNRVISEGTGQVAARALGAKGAPQGGRELFSPSPLHKHCSRQTWRSLLGSWQRTAGDKAVAQLRNLLGQMSLRVLPGTAAFQPRQKGGARGSVPRAWGQRGAGEAQPLGQPLGLQQEVPAWCCCWPWLAFGGEARPSSVSPRQEPAAGQLEPTCERQHLWGWWAGSVLHLPSYLLEKTPLVSVTGLFLHKQ